MATAHADDEIATEVLLLKLARELVLSCQRDGSEKLVRTVGFFDIALSGNEAGPAGGCGFSTGRAFRIRGQRLICIIRCGLAVILRARFELA